MHVQRERDVLGDILLNARPLVGGCGVFDVAAPWSGQLQLHKIAVGAVLLEGPCWVEAEGLPLRKLEPGDGILTGPGHRLRLMSSLENRQCGPASLCAGESLAGLATGDQRYSGPVAKVGQGSSRTRLLVYGVLADTMSSSCLVQRLPPAISLKGNGAKWLRWVDAAAEFFAGEDIASPGYTASATRLIELLFTEFIRTYAATADEPGSNWLSNLIDPSIGRAISCIHGRAGEHWTVARLAREAGLGRSKFARRFTELLGVPPIDYLIDHRMKLARARLAIDRKPVGVVASEVGYKSERAFRQSFCKRFGVPPSRYIKAGVARTSL